MPTPPGNISQVYSSFAVHSVIATGQAAAPQLFQVARVVNRLQTMISWFQCIGTFVALHPPDYISMAGISLLARRSPFSSKFPSFWNQILQR
jgi:hypothetical protein